MEKVLRVGVVGCGEIAQIAHLPYLKELPGFEVRAICDVSAKVLSAVGERFCVKERYLSFEDMVRQPDLDAILVCNRDHAAPAIAAMAAGKHVMVEKPMAFNLEQADKMIATARENSVKLMVAYMKRYDPGYEWALTLIADIQNPHLIRVHDFGGSYEINKEIYELVKPTDVPSEQAMAGAAKERADLISAIGDEREDLVDAFALLMHNCSHDANVLQGAFGRPKQVLHADIYDREFVLASLDYGENTRCIWETGLERRLQDWDEQLTVYASNCRMTLRFPFPLPEECTNDGSCSGNGRQGKRRKECRGVI
jgi:hypothetical protein